MSSIANLAVSGLASSTPPIGFAAAILVLCALSPCAVEETFGDKTGYLHDAIVCMVSADFVLRETKDGLQSFLQRFEGN